jgi:hypothetical protein
MINKLVCEAQNPATHRPAYVRKYRNSGPPRQCHGGGLVPIDVTLTVLFAGWRHIDRNEEVRDPSLCFIHYDEA